MTARLVACDGTVVRLEVERYMSTPSAAEQELLMRAPAPVLDVGCGPGRHVLALVENGRVALGVDVAPTTIDMARCKGAPVLLRSIFDRVPAAGRWGSALLLDGNIGIGGNPESLLTRLGELLRPHGRVLAELEPPGAGTRSLRMRIESAGITTPAFPWARVGVDDVSALSLRAGFELDHLWSAEGRWFVNLRRQ
ncbi:MAG: class I SAM-dependent methyltransferase [Actinomycetota bacterium]